MNHRPTSEAVTLLATLLSLAACGGTELTVIPGDGGAIEGSAGAGGGADVGASGSAGSAGDDGGSTTCLSDTVTFEMIAWRPEGGTPVDYCAGGCGKTWLTIKTAGSETLLRSNFCDVDCNSCSPVVCPPLVCAPPSHLSTDGITDSWDGTYFTSSVCGANSQCEQKQCAAAGSHWVATMCAYPGPEDSGSSFCTSVSTTPNCIDVPFDYPSAAPVVGTIYPLR